MVGGAVDELDAGDLVSSPVSAVAVSVSLGLFVAVGDVDGDAEGGCRGVRGRRARAGSHGLRRVQGLGRRAGLLVRAALGGGARCGGSRDREGRVRAEFRQAQAGRRQYETGRYEKDPATAPAVCRGLAVAAARARRVRVLGVAVAVVIGRGCGRGEGALDADTATVLPPRGPPLGLTVRVALLAPGVGRALVRRLTRFRARVNYGSVGLSRVGRRYDRRAAPRAREGAVQVPAAGVAVVHDAGRLGSSQVPFLVTPVKVVWGRGGKRQESTRTDAARRYVDRLSCRNCYVFDPLTPPPRRPYCLPSISNVSRNFEQY